MSDNFRKDFTDKASEAIKPDSEKSYGEQAKEKVTDLYDQGAKDAQPDNSKSATQKLSDILGGGDSKN